MLCYEVLDDPIGQDLRRAEVKGEVERMIRAGLFKQVGAGPVCASFSTAVTPPARSWAFPRGMPGISAAMRDRCDDGNLFSDWVAKLVSLCLNCGVHVWVENPGSSWLWRQRRWRRLAADFLLDFFVTDHCAWGMPWRKRTRFLTSGSLAGFRVLCSRDHNHLVLRGTSGATNRTKLAEAYPWGLADTLAVACARDCGWYDSNRRFDPAACARQSCRCVGEASHPGPLRRAGFSRRPAFPDEPVVQPQTRLLGQRVLQGFLTWLAALLVGGCSSYVSAQPLALFPHRHHGSRPHLGAGRQPRPSARSALHNLIRPFCAPRRRRRGAPRAFPRNAAQRLVDYGVAFSSDGSFALPPTHPIPVECGVSGGH